MRTWDELMDWKTITTPEEKVLIQCVASLSTQPNYQHMTPDRIYAQQAKWAWEIHIRHEQETPVFSSTISSEFKL